MNKAMTAAVYGPNARTADAVAKSTARVDARKDAAHDRRKTAYDEQVAALRAATGTWSLKDLFAARNRV